MYALGVSYKDISQHIEEIYAFRVSPVTLTAITDKTHSRIAMMATTTTSVGLSVCLDGCNPL
ncbi:hypothetical protein A9G29_10290 [Gilliamella sp. Fer2-1]|jgi:transposase-like protein|nr:hypothetical protein A9G29_10290 [Gilliamella apicola]